MTKHLDQAIFRLRALSETTQVAEILRSRQEARDGQFATDEAIANLRRPLTPRVTLSTGVIPA
jgi:hypothetical protein